MEAAMTTDLPDRDPCDGCTEPVDCGQEGSATYDEHGNILICFVRVQIDDDAGPTGEAACECCGNMEHDSTPVPYGDRMVSMDTSECSEGQEAPLAGHYCPCWKRAYTREDYESDLGDMLAHEI